MRIEAIYFSGKTPGKHFYVNIAKPCNINVLKSLENMNYINTLRGRAYRKIIAMKTYVHFENIINMMTDMSMIDFIYAIDLSTHLKLSAPLANLVIHRTCHTSIIAFAKLPYFHKIPAFIQYTFQLNYLHFQII